MSSSARNASAMNARAMAEFRKQLERLPVEFDESAKRIVNQFCAVAERESKRVTPVGKYPKDVSFVTRSGKVVRFTTGVKKQGGTLRRGWYRVSAKKYGKAWAGAWANNVSYAGYVNDGHRVVRNGETIGYVEGRFMLEIGQRAAEKALPSLLNAEIARIKGKTGF